ncbi:hypothetical protein VNO77_19792 [Canavalia gladiata]|uniref:Uncharacterized protein n=1 Tax=Canavalia gladiata TaxID=3824 RepID=A0AAN9LRK4_CANGL
MGQNSLPLLLQRVGSLNQKAPFCGDLVSTIASVVTNSKTCILIYYRTSEVALVQLIHQQEKTYPAFSTNTSFTLKFDESINITLQEKDNFVRHWKEESTSTIDEVIKAIDLLDHQLTPSSKQRLSQPIAQTRSLKLESVA